MGKSTLTRSFSNFSMKPASIRFCPHPQWHRSSWALKCFVSIFYLNRSARPAVARLWEERVSAHYRIVGAGRTTLVCSHMSSQSYGTARLRQGVPNRLDTPHLPHIGTDSKRPAITVHANRRGGGRFGSPRETLARS